MTGNPTLRKIGIGAGIAAGQFVLLIIGGWAFVAGIGGLLGYAYSRTSNRGLLIGLALGLAVELVLAREGGVAILAGVGVGLLGLTIIDWLKRRSLLWWALVGGLAAVGVSVALWSTKRADLGLFLTIFPFIILALLGIAGFEFWRGRKIENSQAA